MKKLILALAVVIGLSACATDNDVQMVKYHMDAEVAIAQSKADLGIAQSEAIAATLDSNSTDLERYLAREQIAGIKVTPSGIKSITTGNDVVMLVAKDGRAIIKDVVTGAVIWRGIVGLENIMSEAGGTSIVAEEGATVDFDQTNQKAVVGKGNVEQTNKRESSREDQAVDGVLDNGCDEDTPIFYEGTCYSEASAAERGFPIDQ